MVLSPRSSPRGELLSQYVCVRVTRMDGVDIGLFDFDRHNTLYFFALNAEEQIYLRYGGRTDESPTSHLSLESLRQALRKGLEQHDIYRRGSFEPPPRPEARYPRQIGSLRDNVMQRGRCVECHLIADYRAQDLEAAGRLDKRRMMYVSPDIERLGLTLDRASGVGVAAATDAAETAGLRAGDVITAVEGERVLTFGDLQYQYDRLSRDSRQVLLRLARAGRTFDVTVPLPLEWWRTDLFFRYWSVEPLLYFSSHSLRAEVKSELGLAADGFACEVDFVERRAAAFGHHQLQVGDIVFSVDGVESNRQTSDCEVHLKLETIAGATSTLGVLRQGERRAMTLRSGRQHFRKAEPRVGSAARPR